MKKYRDTNLYCCVFSELEIVSERQILLKSYQYHNWLSCNWFRLFVDSNERKIIISNQMSLSSIWMLYKVNLAEYELHKDTSPEKKQIYTDIRGTTQDMLSHVTLQDILQYLHAGKAKGGLICDATCSNFGNKLDLFIPSGNYDRDNMGVDPSLHIFLSPRYDIPSSPRRGFGTVSRLDNLEIENNGQKYNINLYHKERFGGSNKKRKTQKKRKRKTNKKRKLRKFISKKYNYK
jgi:hypothetical protein